MDIADVDPTKLKLHNNWIIYQYSKNTFKKLSQTQDKVKDMHDIKMNPYKQLFKITNVHELLSIIKIMGITIDPRTNIRNMDKNDLIIMRDGIEPLWEDEKNANGGTYSLKIDHEKGYKIWTLLMMYILGETFTKNMDDINGISVSYIKGINVGSSTKNSPQDYTYIKIWNSNPKNNMDNIQSLFPSDIMDTIKNDSIMYLKHNTKKDFNQPIINKFKNMSKKDRPDINIDNDGFKRVPGFKKKNK
jgi:hypothetical protein